MFAFPNMFHFFTHEFAGLGRRRLGFALIFARPFDWFFFWHTKNVSPLAARLDVMKGHRPSPDLSLPGGGDYFWGSGTRVVGPSPHSSDPSDLGPTPLGLLELSIISRGFASISSTWWYRGGFL